jgi:hypothetical protein
MKRLLDEADPSFGVLRELVQSAEPHHSSPFVKRAMESRIRAALAAGAGVKRSLWRPGLVGVGALLVAATAAAAGYSYLAPEKALSPVAPPSSVVVAPRLPAPDAGAGARGSDAAAVDRAAALRGSRRQTPPREVGG